jgi:hypothetical protein
MQMKTKKPKKLPRERNFFAASLYDPKGPYRPKVTPTQKDKIRLRQQVRNKSWFDKDSLDD